MPCAQFLLGSEPIKAIRTGAPCQQSHSRDARPLTVRVRFVVSVPEVSSQSDTQREFEMSLKGKAAAIGIGEVKPFKEAGDLTALGLMAKVSAEAIEDAGLEKKDIDGFLVGMPFSDPGMLY